MKKSELVAKVAKDSGVTVKETNLVIKTLIETIKTSMSKGEKVTISGFGSFERKKRKETIARNPKTGERMTIAAQNMATFRAGSSLKQAIK